MPFKHNSNKDLALEALLPELDKLQSLDTLEGA